MRVNSAFTGFSINHLPVRSGIAIVMLVFFFVASSFTDHSSRELRAKQMNLIIRQIGHRLLLQAGDSTSRVMPVAEIREGTFLLKFENKFVFNHDSLMVLSQALLPKTQFSSGYTITVHDCAKGDIVYGFQVNNTSPDILACSGRSQPVGCYMIEFAFPDFYEHVAQKKADIASVKVNAWKDNTKQEKLNTITFNDHSGQPAKETTSVNINPQEVNAKSEEFQTATFKYPLTIVVYAGILLFLVGALLIWRFRKISNPVPVQNGNHAIMKESGPELAALGKLLYNVKGQRLLSGSEVIGLTDKECKVLELLHKNFGELIPRDTLMQEVWINEGVITGRSLDMFISKLRKKLSVDPDLRITNIHGKGYRLETVHDSIVS